MPSESNLELTNEERLQDGVPFSYYRSIPSANTEGSIGSDFCLAEMPLEAWITYNNNLYQIIRFENNTGLMVCRDKCNAESIHRLDASDNATYWGYWNNVPQNYRLEN